MLACFTIHAQSDREKRIQEWEKVLQSTHQDTTKVRAYFNLALTYRAFDIKKAQENSQKALNLAIKTNHKYYIAKSLVTISADLTFTGEFKKSLLYSKKALHVLNADTININNNTAIENIALGQIYAEIAIAYDYQSESAKAIKYYLAALDIYEHIGKRDGQAVLMNNLGVSYLYANEYEKAEEYFLKTKQIYLELKDTISAVQIETNLGIITYIKGDTLGAIEIYKRTGNIMWREKNLRSAGNAWSNVAEVYGEINQLDSAIHYLNKAIEIDKKLDDRESLGTSYRVKGNIHRAKNEFEKARENYRLSLDLAEEIDRKHDIAECYKLMYFNEYEAKNYQEALNLHKLYIAYEDSIQLASNSEKLGKVEAENEFNKQLAIQKAEDEQKIKLEEEKGVTQKIINYFIFAVIIVILFFVYMVWKSLQLAKKQKELATDAKHQIEEKNREILDSIKYAKRIQEALLKDEHEGVELPEHFLLYQPKDIVSGDFYWSYVNDDFWYLAVADCTGHGVPGAMLTMLGNAYLNELCAKGSNPEPAELLDLLKEKITKELSQKGEQGGSKDGMDISLVKINLHSNRASWAGANNPLYLIRGHHIEEIKADKQPIGYSEKVKPFSNHQFEFQKGDQIYLFSDGFADQFGGEKGKKFKYSNFKKLLLDSCQLAPKDQEYKLRTTFESWKGDLEQLDDICVIGLKL